MSEVKIIEQDIDAILKILSDNKGKDIVRFDVKGKTALADNIIIVSANNSRHIHALTEYLLTGMKDLGYKNIKLEGARQCDWVLLDSGDNIIHIMSEEIRQYYKLEELWENIAEKQIIV